jgi:hypothetical protein
MIEKLKLTPNNARACLKSSIVISNAEAIEWILTGLEQ